MLPAARRQAGRARQAGGQAGRHAAWRAGRQACEQAAGKAGRESPMPTFMHMHKHASAHARMHAHTCKPPRACRQEYELPLLRGPLAAAHGRFEESGAGSTHRSRHLHALASNKLHVAG